ncbi:MAG: hypothetical protein M3083_14815 [Actinomycetota bacterium]|nr:hypothetical protein [Actinomycetota bacterium]
MDEVAGETLPPLGLELDLMARLHPRDPQPVYYQTRARCPVARTPTGAVAVFDMEDRTRLPPKSGD